VRDILNKTMAEYLVKRINKKEVWEKFVLSQYPKSFLHSWNWGQTAFLCGDKVIRIGFYIDKKLKGVCQLIKQKARRGPHFLIPGGPLIEWNDRRLVNLFIKTIKDFAKDENVWFVRIRPELLDNSRNRELFRKLGFVSAPMHLHAENTWVLNITPDQNILLSNMRKTTRYLIRKSLSSDLSFVKSLKTDDSKVLYKLQTETVRRHNFVGFPQRLFSAQIETFAKDGQGALYYCQKGKKVLAAAIIIFYGDIAYYHHSASASSDKQIPFSYFLQWKIIEEAKKKGCKYYNFWGIAPTDNPKHRFAGVTLFKKGFGGGQENWLHAHDFPISPLYWLTYLFEISRRMLRKL
jgi:peptidoglycan pentaglycine glycine transferase (the first glycine)